MPRRHGSDGKPKKSNSTTNSSPEYYKPSPSEAVHGTCIPSRYDSKPNMARSSVATPADKVASTSGTPTEKAGARSSSAAANGQADKIGSQASSLSGLGLKETMTANYIAAQTTSHVGYTRKGGRGVPKHAVKRPRERSKKPIEGQESAHSKESKLHKKTVLTEEVKHCLSAHGYQVAEAIDDGSTSTVFKVTQTENKQAYACKIMSNEKITFKQFKSEEIELCSGSVLQHPFIITYIMSKELKEHSFIIMELATGGDMMGKVISSKDPPNLSLAKDWFYQISQALVYLHALGITHRDIKGDNVMLCNHMCTAKLSDFGYAQHSIERNGEPKLTTVGCGTLEYKAPEQLQPKPWDPFKADCYSMGVFLYTLVTHRFPFYVSDKLSGEARVKEMYNMIVNKSWSLHDYPEAGGDKNLESLLSQLLNPSVEGRISANQIVAHLWFKNIVGL